MLPTTRADAERHLIAHGAPPDAVLAADTLMIAVGATARRYARDGSTVDLDLELGVAAREETLTAAPTHCVRCAAIGVGQDGLCPQCVRRAARRARLVRYGLSHSRGQWRW
jgi:hypothetical protein